MDNPDDTNATRGISQSIRQALDSMRIDPMKSLDMLLDIESTLISSSIDSLHVLSSHLSAMAACYKAIDRKRECLMYLTKLLQTEKLIGDALRLGKTYLNISAVLNDLKRPESLIYCVKGTETLLNMRKQLRQNLQGENGEKDSKNDDLRRVSTEAVYGLVTLIRLYNTRGNSHKASESQVIASILIDQDFVHYRDERKKLTEMINNSKKSIARRLLVKPDKLDGLLKKQCALSSHHRSMGSRSERSKSSMSSSGNANDGLLKHQFSQPSQPKSYRIAKSDRPSSSFAKTSASSKPSRPFSADFPPRTQWPPVQNKATTKFGEKT